MFKEDKLSSLKKHQLNVISQKVCWGYYSHNVPQSSQGYGDWIFQKVIVKVGIAAFVSLDPSSTILIAFLLIDGK